MKSRELVKSLLISSFVVLSAVLVIARPAVVGAESRRDNDMMRAEEMKSEHMARLESTKLKVCKNRETAIKNIMSHAADRGTRHLEVFSKISERVQAFYAEKGKTLSNYDALVSEVEAKKAAAETAIAEVKNASSNFNCEGDNPKADAAAFKEDIKAMRTALHEYRTAIKNLIVGVKSVQSTDAKTEDGGTE